MSVLVLTPLLVPLGTALLAALLHRRDRARRAASLAGGLVLLGCAVALMAEVLRHGRLSVALGGWPLPYGIEMAADPLGAGLVLVAAALAVAALLQQRSSADPAPESPALHPLLHGLLAAVGGAFLTADLFNLYVWFELMLVTTLGLLVLGGEARHLDAAFKYLVLSLFGTVLLLLAVALIYGATGHLHLPTLAAAAAGPRSAVLPVLVTVLTLALLLKAGAFPLFGWLPASYHTLPAPLLALIGGLLTKVAVYAVLRLLAGVFHGSPPALYQALGWLAVATMVTGVLGAAYHWDLRRILAFHIVSQVGYLLLGVALASAAGAVATVFFTLHNILAKAALFLIAGIVWRLAGHYDLRRVGGLYQTRPGLALLFLLAAGALVGVPPLSGFWAKLLLVRASLSGEEYLWAAAALGVSLLTLYSMAKIWIEAFWKPHPGPRAPATAVTGLGPAYAGASLLVALTLAMGLVPEPFLRYAEAAVAALAPAGETTP
jgi:multicomponent Na+:H+ antiporter subunit D